MSVTTIISTKITFVQIQLNLAFQKEFYER